MLSLVELQRWFVEQVADWDLAVEERSPARSAEDLRTADLVLPSQHMTGAERVAIYRGAYRERLVECLAEDYPALGHALGDSLFRALALVYIGVHPSRSANLNFFGRHLADLCRDGGLQLAAPAPAPLPAFAGDLAELEWALVEVLHAPSLQRLTRESLASIAPDQWPHARFVAAPTLRLVSTRFAVNAFYQAFREGEAPGEPAETNSSVAVFRDGLTLWRMDLATPMQRLLRALIGGETLGQAFNRLAETTELAEDAAPAVMASFREWVGHGFFSDIELPGAG